MISVSINLGGPAIIPELVIQIGLASACLQIHADGNAIVDRFWPIHSILDVGQIATVTEIHSDTDVN
jgi:hypothetical protein